MADRFMLFRMKAKEVARSHGYEATFMPKPWSDRTGGGAHFNMSLASADGGDNLFAPGAEDQTAATSPSSATASSRASWPTPRHRGGDLPDGELVQAAGPARRDERIHVGARLHLLRPQQPHAHGPRADEVATRGVARGRRLCQRLPRAALVLAAGLDGISRELDPGPPIARDMYVQTDDQIAELGVGLLPRTLSEAIDAFESDPLTLDVFGPDLHEAYIEFKRAEWEDFPTPCPSGSGSAT